MPAKLIGDATTAIRLMSTVLERIVARSRVTWLGALALCAAGFGLAPAQAETLSISATGLVLRCPCSGDNTDSAQESNGVFEGEKPNGRYFIPVVFPVTSGQQVCSFSMAYQDINQQDTMTVRLLRKSYAVGGDPFAAPVVLATLKSAAGVVNTVRVATTNAIHAPTITPLRSFYYIEADIVTTNLNLLGFQIVYKPTCP